MDYAYMSFGERRKVRDVYGTQIFSYPVDSIPASSKTIIDLSDEKPTWKKYLPFNSVTITNNGGTDIKVYINQQNNFYLYIPSGVIKTYTSENLGIWSMLIENLSSTTATTSNQIIMEFERLGMTSNKLSKNIAEIFKW